MPKVDLDRTIHAGGKVFFKGEAFVSDEDAALIEAEQKRLADLEGEQPEENPEEKPETPKKTTKKTEK